MSALLSLRLADKTSEAIPLERKSKLKSAALKRRREVSKRRALLRGVASVVSGLKPHAYIEPGARPDLIALKARLSNVNGCVVRASCSNRPGT